MEEGRKVLTLKEVCEMLGISAPTLRRAVKKGLLPQPLKVGTRRVAWPASEVEDFLLRKTMQA